MRRGEKGSNSRPEVVVRLAGPPERARSSNARRVEVVICGWEMAAWGRGVRFGLGRSPLMRPGVAIRGGRGKAC